MTKQDFLFELGCEELPPKALPKLATSLLNSMKESLGAANLQFDDSEWFATPRRIAVRFIGLDEKQADKSVEKLGPAIAAAFDADGNPKPAAIGFAKSNQTTVAELTEKETDKGTRLAYIAKVKGQSAEQLLPTMLTKAIASLPVPKNMRWGDTDYQFSRPVQWVLSLLGEKVLPLEILGESASNYSYGHRFHSNGKIEIVKACDYEAQLSKAHVVVCFEERKAKIRQQAEALAKEKNAVAIVSEGLLEEVAALVEWPVALLGQFDEAFLDVPAEALVSSMAEHQKYFHLESSSGALLPYFITISNIESKNPQSVIAGNEKVIRPRLADAKFFFDTDNKQRLEDNLPRLEKIVFQDQLGSLADKCTRVGLLSKVIANSLGVDQALVSRASKLYKCDLVSEMVNEFSDLQGTMGRYYATSDNEPQEVADAMGEVYMPRFSGDSLPKSQTGLVLAIAERMDTLVGIFGIGKIPTGAKDPFALRRAALGVLRLISEKELELDLAWLIEESIKTFSVIELNPNTPDELFRFFNARQRAMLQEQGFSLQVIQSVEALKVSQPFDFKVRVSAVSNFALSEESKDLSEANKRVGNILTKSTIDWSTLAIDPLLFENTESQLFDQLNDVSKKVEKAVDDKNYQLALDSLASLKAPVNAFFDNVMINAEDESLRKNRLALIGLLRSLFMQIADISLLQK